MTLSATSFVSTRYVGVYYRLFLIFNSWIFDKPLKLWCEKAGIQKANMQMSSYHSRPLFEYGAYISRYLQAAHWVSDRFLARFVHRGCCYGVYYEYSLTKVAFGGTAENLHSFFRGRKLPKLLKRLTMGQAVPEIPLSVGSKLELHVLLRAFVFAKFPCTSSYTHAFVRVCTFIVPCIFIIILAIRIVRKRMPRAVFTRYICQPAPSTTADVSKYHALGLVHVLCLSRCVGLPVTPYIATCKVWECVRGSIPSITYGRGKSVHAQENVTDKHTYIHARKYTYKRKTTIQQN